MEIIPATPVIPSHVHVGTSPTGVTWNVYPKLGETEDDLEKRVSTASERLQALHERHEAQTIQVSRLTCSAIWLIVDRGGLFEELRADYEALVIGRSYVKGTRRFLEDVALSLEATVDDHGEMASCGVNSDRTERADFAERSARRSILVAIKRIRYALEGKKQPRRVKV